MAGTVSTGPGSSATAAPAGPRFGSDIVHDWPSHLRVWVACGAVLATLRGHAADPVWLEQRWIGGVGVELAQSLAWASSLVPAAYPLTVGETLLGALIGLEIWRTLDAVAEVGARRRRLSNALFGGALHVASVGLVLLVWFYGAWGLCYARAPLADRVDWPPPPDPVVVERRAEIVALAEDAVARTNAAYRDVHGSDGADGTPLTGAPPAAEVDGALEAGFGCVGRLLDAPSSFRERRTPAKVPRASEAMSWLGIGGIYFPFTGEPHVNGAPPAFSQVFTRAHEKAHQRMIGPEDEASFVGFLAMICAGDPLYRYAAWEFASRQLLRPVYQLDRAEGERIAALFSPGVRRDQEAVRAFWTSHKGPIEAWSRWSNDHYLRAHRVEGGVQAYGRAGRLIAAFLQTDDGRALAEGRRPGR